MKPKIPIRWATVKIHLLLSCIIKVPRSQFTIANDILFLLTDYFVEINLPLNGDFLVALRGGRMGMFSLSLFHQFDIIVKLTPQY